MLTVYSFDHSEPYYTFDHHALTCTDKDLYYLDLVTFILKPRTILEIGSYVGTSASRLAKYGAKVVCVDNFSECADRLSTINQFWLNTSHLDIDLYCQCFSDFELQDDYDLVFLDANHIGDNPQNDIKKLISVVTCPILVHDTWMPGVRKACDYLVSIGYKEFIFDTQTKLGIYAK